METVEAATFLTQFKIKLNRDNFTLSVFLSIFLSMVTKKGNIESMESLEM